MRYRFQQQRLLVDNGVLNTRRALEVVVRKELALRFELSDYHGWRHCLETSGLFLVGAVNAIPQVLYDDQNTKHTTSSLASRMVGNWIALSKRIHSDPDVEGGMLRSNGLSDGDVFILKAIFDEYGMPNEICKDTPV